MRANVATNTSKRLTSLTLLLLRTVFLLFLHYALKEKHVCALLENFWRLPLKVRWQSPLTKVPGYQAKGKVYNQLTSSDGTGTKHASFRCDKNFRKRNFY